MQGRGAEFSHTFGGTTQRQVIGRPSENARLISRRR
jgi:hypothetical protein